MNLRRHMRLKAYRTVNACERKSRFNLGLYSFPFRHSCKFRRDRQRLRHQIYFLKALFLDFIILHSIN